MPSARTASRPRAAEDAAPPAKRRAWLRIAVPLAILLLLGAAWQWTPLRALLDLDRIQAWVEPHRTSWVAFPLVIAAFVLLGLLMVPVLLLIVATGIAFGPWLGSTYALAGAIASASFGFWLGRRVGLPRVERIAGPRVKRVSDAVERNGTLAVYVIRKIPMPFLLINMVMGASRIRFRDFFLGTFLGMGPIVVALAGFGYQLSETLKDPSPVKIGIAAGLLLVPFTIAFVVNRRLKQR